MPSRLMSRGEAVLPGGSLAILGMLALALVIRIILAPGLSGNDDMSMAGGALGLLDQGFTLPTSHYAARFGLLIPLAGIFKVFGIGIAQLIALPMAMSLLGIFIAWRLGCLLFDPRTGLFAAAALAFYPMDIEFAGLFFPDLIEGALLALTFLLLLQASRAVSGTLYAIFAGISWGVAYYIKIDAGIFGVVLLAGLLGGLLRWPMVIIAGIAAAALVGVELVLYAKFAGSPLYHATLEHRALNEFLTASAEYRDPLVYPRAMFLAVVQTGLHFYLLLATFVLVMARPSRGGVFLAFWVLFSLAWLTLGFDPFDARLQLRPQLPRYLEIFAIPMCVLIGALLAWCYAGLHKLLVAAACLGCAVLAVLLVAYSGLTYQAGRATIVATEQAKAQRWLPLYTDNQSFSTVQFLLHGSLDAARAQPIQMHNFLTGTTRFETIAEDRAYLLINPAFARRLQKRNGVVPVSPTQFGMRATLVSSIDRPLPAIDYAVLALLVAVGDLVPMPALRTKLHDIADDVLQPGSAQIYLLQR